MGIGAAVHAFARLDSAALMAEFADHIAPLLTRLGDPINELEVA